MNSLNATFIRHCFLVLILGVPAWCQKPGPARPGSINYVDGQASIGSTLLTPGAIGAVVLEKDQLLTTQAGKVEILLTPGVFLRVAENSSVKMVSPDLATTKVELEKGRALVEVIQIRKKTISESIKRAPARSCCREVCMISMRVVIRCACSRARPSWRHS